MIRLRWLWFCSRLCSLVLEKVLGRCFFMIFFLVFGCSFGRNWLCGFCGLNRLFWIFRWCICMMGVLLVWVVCISMLIFVVVVLRFGR